MIVVVGDLLMVELCNLGPLPGDEWGFTGTFDRENGGGFLTDHFPAATKVIFYRTPLVVACSYDWWGDCVQTTEALARKLLGVSNNL
jgi:acetamidase/formamidase